MRVAILCSLFLCQGLFAQPVQEKSPAIRSIRVKAISGCKAEPFSPIAFEAIAAAWKAAKVNLSLETTLDSDSIGAAKGIIRQMYARTGRIVRVDHEINPTAPQGIEVYFQVLHLCRGR